MAARTEAEAEARGVPNSPTPHTDVNALLAELVAGACGTLGARLTGAYLVGSLAGGDFDTDSDIDVIIVTRDELPSSQIAALGEMHARLATGDGWWPTQLEVSYIPEGALRRYDPARALHPHIGRGRGEHLGMMHHDIDWMTQRRTLRERGITLAGPDPRTLVDPVSPDDLRRAMPEIIRLWGDPLLSDDAPLARRGGQSYMVLSMCRALYTLGHGEVVSKRVAATWAEAALSARWVPLIRRAWDGRRDPDARASREEVDETLALVRYVLERGERLALPPAVPATPHLRLATPADVPAIEALMALSVRGLSDGFYTSVQVESALRHAFGVDSQLIADGTYFVMESGPQLVAAGGWSARRTLHGGDRAKGADDDPRLDPAAEPARIRAFFVHPAWARRGLARALFARSLEAARAAGFRSLELVATLPGEPLYAALGFVARERMIVPLPDGLALPCVSMTRPVGGDPSPPGAAP
ncbi:MAG: GNAT family N-acetyltransferase [Gemmatimonadaceae bacterium]